MALRFGVWFARRWLWRTHELLPQMLESEKYLTDEVHLYEVIQVCKNAGVWGGQFVTVRDCLDESTRVLSPLESKLCRPVR